MAAATRYSIAKQFTLSPGHRYRARGTNSGEEFREDVLVPMVRAGAGKVVIDLDGTIGYGSSFLEEAFGGLVRREKWTAKQFWDKFDIVSKDDTSYLFEVRQYVDDAARYVHEASGTLNLGLCQAQRMGIE